MSLSVLDPAVASKLLDVETRLNEAMTICKREASHYLLAKTSDPMGRLI